MNEEILNEDTQKADATKRFYKGGYLGGYEPKSVKLFNDFKDKWRIDSPTPAPEIRILYNKINALKNSRAALCAAICAANSGRRNQNPFTLIAT